MKIKSWLRDGHHGLSKQDINNTEDLLAAAGRCLDKACSGDIMGEIVFEGEDGKTYVGNVEFVIMEANTEYVESVKQEIEENDKDDRA